MNWKLILTWPHTSQNNLVPWWAIVWRIIWWIPTHAARYLYCFMILIFTLSVWQFMAALEETR